MLYETCETNGQLRIILISASLAGQIRVEQRTEEAGVDHTEHAQVAYDLDGK